MPDTPNTSEEHPPLGKSYLVAFEQNDADFPLLGVRKYPGAGGYALPAVGSTTGLSTEFIARYPNNKFSRAMGISEQRVLWIYEILPGPTTTTTRIDTDGATVTITTQRKVLADITTGSSVATGIWTRQYKGEGDSVAADQITETRAIPGNAVTTTRYDKESDTVYTEVRTLKLLSTITEGASIDGSTMVAVESVPIDNIVGYEVVTTWPQATAHDLASAIVIDKDTLPFRFPGTLDVILYMASLGRLGHTDTYVREVPQTTKAYWVNSATVPDISSQVNGIPAPANVYSLLQNGSSIGEVMYNDITIFYEVPSMGIDYPGSTPNLTDYLADWVGGDPRVVKGRVTEAGSRFRWKVELTELQFIVPAQPSYVLPP